MSVYSTIGPRVESSLLFFHDLSAIFSFYLVSALPVNLQSTDPGMRLEMIRMAVIKIMDMNSSVYCHLHSDTFDVPDYEKENIVYNNEVSS